MDNQAPEPLAPPHAAAANSDSSPKGLAIIGYIFPVLFFLPLVTNAKNSASARYHANQQLILLIWFVIANIIIIIPLLGWIASPLMVIFGILLIVLGIINVVSGKQKPLLLIGRFELIK